MTRIAMLPPKILPLEALRPVIQDIRDALAEVGAATRGTVLDADIFIDSVLSADRVLKLLDRKSQPVAMARSSLPSLGAFSTDAVQDCGLISDFIGNANSVVAALVQARSDSLMNLNILPSVEQIDSNRVIQGFRVVDSGNERADAIAQSTQVDFTAISTSLSQLTARLSGGSYSIINGVPTCKFGNVDLEGSLRALFASERKEPN